MNEQSRLSKLSKFEDFFLKTKKWIQSNPFFLKYLRCMSLEDYNSNTQNREILQLTIDEKRENSLFQREGLDTARFSFQRSTISPSKYGNLST